VKEPNEALAPEAPPGTPEANLSGPAKPEKSPLLREVRSLAVRLAVFAAVLWVLLTQVYLVTQASGSEMFPAVKDGDLVLGCRLEKDYAKNDVVVYERSGRLRVGRVLARGGDIVTLSESGVVEVNGSAQGGGILYPTYPKSLLSYPYAVPEDSVFILVCGQSRQGSAYRKRCCQQGRCHFREPSHDKLSSFPFCRSDIGSIRASTTVRASVYSPEQVAIARNCAPSGSFSSARRACASI
jgi:signal peptidase I